MSVKIRLTRTGAKNDACYRVVAIDSRTRRDGTVLETLGWYDPKKQEQECSLKSDRVQHWVQNGAEVSATVKSLIRKSAKQAEAIVPQEAEAQAEA
ncbi:MAG: 30S ribosomal protein S16 [Verrucomicrobiota bacterium]